MPECVIFVSGLLQVASMFQEILLEALDKPAPGCRPPLDEHCYAATAWTAALLAPAAALLRMRDMATAIILTGAARPIKYLMTRLELSRGAPFATALRAGAARPQLLAPALQELLGAAIFVQQLNGERAAAGLVGQHTALLCPATGLRLQGMQPLFVSGLQLLADVPAHAPFCSLPTLALPHCPTLAPAALPHPVLCPPPRLLRGTPHQHMEGLHPGPHRALHHQLERHAAAGAAGAAHRQRGGGRSHPALCAPRRTGGGSAGVSR